MSQHRIIRIAVGVADPWAARGKATSNLDEFLSEAARRGTKVLGFERAGETWRVKVMAPK